MFLSVPTHAFFTPNTCSCILPTNAILITYDCSPSRVHLHPNQLIIMKDQDHTLEIISYSRIRNLFIFKKAEAALWLATTPSHCAYPTDMGDSL
jgi:hypothetical protein